MIIDTKEMDHEFTIEDIDGFKLINPSEIGTEVAMQFLENEKIISSDIMYEIQLYFNNLINEIFDKTEDVLNENNRKIKYE